MGSVQASVTAAQWALVVLPGVGNPWQAVCPQLHRYSSQVSQSVVSQVLLAQSAQEQGEQVVAAYMGHVLANAEESVRRLLDRLDATDPARGKGASRDGRETSQ